ncbi:hypothetical protein JMJ56_29400 [Belnapia sp. T18]|uniref:Uncharacterized protein n=1 Tax=Belnapia arida TaxID=2804533 RepID=A0ABS1UBM7_9PROT|nr:hypothetical protein [Belnapia arida]MBL6082097.1 hypothetical protein [Belnapia arida]
MKPIEARVVRLERAGGTGWEAFRHLPLAEWPDAALWAFLGLPESTSNAELQRIADTAPEVKETRA